MSLATPKSVQKLQTALHVKAKGSPELRFYTLYDKMYRTDVLTLAYDCCLANRGAAGVDDQTFDNIEAYGRERWLGELAEVLKKKTYRPEAVRRVMIPKPGQPERMRPLGIPTIRDRVTQMAAVLVLEPIFEADLQPEQYAYRRERSALDAVRHVHKLLNSGRTEVVDADLSGYFDEIPHAELMKSVARRISDRSMLHLIKMWLEAPVEETDERGHKRRMTRNKDEGCGTPQGAPVSPLLSNGRCHQENLIEQLKNGVHALRMPVGDLVSNWAYMVMASLAWTLKAWFALLLPQKGRWKDKHRREKAAVLSMEFKRFVNAFVRVPALVVRTGRRLMFQLLSWNPWQEVFLRGIDALRTPMRC